MTVYQTKKVSGFFIAKKGDQINVSQGKIQSAKEG